MKKIGAITTISFSLIISGCASNGGLAMASNGGCDMGVSSSVGALLGAAAGYAVSKGHKNSSSQNNRAIAIGALAGGALSAGICLAINARTLQTKSALDVEQQYTVQNGSLPDQTEVKQYSTALSPGNIISTNNNIVVRSDLLVVEGQKIPLSNLKETLVLKNADGKVLKTITKDVTQTGSYGSGEFNNSFTWKFPANVSKGRYTIETDLYVNGNKAGNNVKYFTLV